MADVAWGGEMPPVLLKLSHAEAMCLLSDLGEYTLSDQTLEIFRVLRRLLED